MQKKKVPYGRVEPKPKKSAPRTTALDLLLMDQSPLGKEKRELQIHVVPRVKRAATALSRFALNGGTSGENLTPAIGELSDILAELQQMQARMKAAHGSAVRRGAPSELAAAPAAKAARPQHAKIERASAPGTAGPETRVRVQYTPAGERPRLYTLRLVPYLVGANVADAVSLRTEVGRQLAQLSNGDTLRGSLFGQRSGEILVLSVD
jgi:hypothetical protein